MRKNIFSSLNKNLLLISIVSFSVSIVLYLIAQIWYSVRTNIFNYMINLEQNPTSLAVISDNLIIFNLISSIITAIGLIPLIILLIHKYKSERNENRNKINWIKIKKILLIISIVIFSISIAWFIFGYILYFINFPGESAQFFSNGQPVKIIWTNPILPLHLASFILTIIGLILVIMFNSKPRETNKSKLAISATM